MADLAEGQHLCLNSTDNLVTSHCSPSRTDGVKQKHRAEKGLNVDIASRCGLLKVNTYLLLEHWLLCKPGSHGLSSCVLSFSWRNYRHLNQKTCVCVMAHRETCYSSCQIKHFCFGKIAVQSVVQEGGIQIWLVFAVFIVIFLSPAVLHWLCVCLCVRVCVSLCPTVSPLSDFAHYGLYACTQHAPVFIIKTIA